MQRQLLKTLCQQQHQQQGKRFLTNQQQNRNFVKWLSAYKSNNKQAFANPQQKNQYSNQTSWATTTTTSAEAATATTTTTTHGVVKPIMTEQQVEEHYLKNHIPLSHTSLRTWGTPYTDVSPLDQLETKRHREPKDAVDKVAYGIMRFLRVFVHAFFGSRYIHHAVVLETVAAVPGMVAGCLRHFTSLRTMTRDHGWIGALVEEAENERMHLLTWMQVVKPTLIQRLLVIAAQVVYTTFYTAAYVISPRFSHRMVGYLEEEAVSAYTQFLEAIDSGDIPNTPAPEIAQKYWNLAPTATLRDVVLAVRADECMHRDYNHTLATKAKAGVH